MYFFVLNFYSSSYIKSLSVIQFFFYLLKMFQKQNDADYEWKSYLRTSTNVLTNHNKVSMCQPIKTQ